ncbi:phage integrase N-terminal SAM-like domain-containing protein [Reinekea sp. G2M2-21]|uniref:phage integrase N-terminal SAM-like domain-containing protein n=1 Tax=Reinekea sp. G2M2-21 TaxID=2788942 RepID=UPI001E43086A|nr:phage integrase N-terminal SAM-like domain-containing protein [Reinekea sp. G2M2-21]
MKCTFTRKSGPIDIRTALPEKPKGFLDQFRVFIRSRGLAYATEKTYLLWAKRFVRFSKYQYPKTLGFRIPTI